MPTLNHNFCPVKSPFVKHPLVKSPVKSAPPSPSPHGTAWKDGLGPDTVTWTVVLSRGAWQVSLKDDGFAMKSEDGEQIFHVIDM